MSNESPADRLRAAAYIPVSIGVVDVLPKTAVVPFDTALEILEQAADEAKTDKAQIVLLTERIAELKHYLAQAREAICGERTSSIEEVRTALPKPWWVDFDDESVLPLYAVLTDRDSEPSELVGYVRFVCPPITEIGEAVKVLNEKKWREGDDWFVWETGEEVYSQSVYDSDAQDASFWSIHVDDALAIANWICQSNTGASVPAEGTWQSIESAPKDGTDILLWWPYWNPNYPVIGQFLRDHWYSRNAISTGPGPTHWMNLPAPPKGSEE